MLVIELDKYFEYHFWTTFEQTPFEHACQLGCDIDVLLNLIHFISPLVVDIGQVDPLKMRVLGRTNYLSVSDLGWIGRYQDGFAIDNAENAYFP